eukprot:6084140-Prymnesium_polylepis.1
MMNAAIHINAGTPPLVPPPGILPVLVQSPDLLARAVFSLDMCNIGGEPTCRTYLPWWGRHFAGPGS